MVRAATQCGACEDAKRWNIRACEAREESGLGSQRGELGTGTGRRESSSGGERERSRALTAREIGTRVDIED